MYVYIYINISVCVFIYLEKCPMSIGRQVNPLRIGRRGESQRHGSPGSSSIAWRCTSCHLAMPCGSGRDGGNIFPGKCPANGGFNMF